MSFWDLPVCGSAEPGHPAFFLATGESELRTSGLHRRHFTPLASFQPWPTLSRRIGVHILSPEREKTSGEHLLCAVLRKRGVLWPSIPRITLMVSANYEVTHTGMAHTAAVCGLLKTHWVHGSSGVLPPSSYP